ncbi:sodium/potassium-transporting ATPase subunit gamma-like isoform X1 [Cyprinus carpio]|uniref:FXYD domain-containing ion transport regulator n=1 Tax=Cyprinus carpio TaxID=7962 RepID=A0A9Q9VA75_CYPCA|nr:sodium/potassium-transporting ATPase subunit gamma-like isoform X1 [Cyprinus carpio]
MGVEKPEYSDADFTYETLLWISCLKLSLCALIPDYELIRRGGLIFAAVLFCLGMAIIFSKKFNCGNKASAKLEDNGDL